jgi:hypothetical protein
MPVLDIFASGVEATTGSNLYNGRPLPDRRSGGGNNVVVWHSNSTINL